VTVWAASHDLLHRKDECMEREYSKMRAKKEGREVRYKRMAEEERDVSNL